MNPGAFIQHLADVSSSPLAYLGYALAVGAWVLAAYLRYRPQRKAEEIIKAYKSDKERNIALRTLTGVDPPPNLRQTEALAWVRLKSKERTQTLMLIAYAITVI